MTYRGALGRPSSATLAGRRYGRLGERQERETGPVAPRSCSCGGRLGRPLRGPCSPERSPTPARARPPVPPNRRRRGIAPRRQGLWPHPRAGAVSVTVAGPGRGDHSPQSRGHWSTVQTPDIQPQSPPPQPWDPGPRTGDPDSAARTRTHASREHHGAAPTLPQEWATVMAAPGAGGRPWAGRLAGLPAWHEHISRETSLGTGRRLSRLGPPCGSCRLVVRRLVVPRLGRRPSPVNTADPAGRSGAPAVARANDGPSWNGSATLRVGGRRGKRVLPARGARRRRLLDRSTLRWVADAFSRSLSSRRSRNRSRTALASTSTSTPF